MNPDAQDSWHHGCIQCTVRKCTLQQLPVLFLSGLSLPPSRRSTQRRWLLLFCCLLLYEHLRCTLRFALISLTTIATFGALIHVLGQYTSVLRASLVRVDYKFL